MNFFCIDDDQNFLNKIENICLNYSIQQNLDINICLMATIPKSVPKGIDAYFLDVEISDNNIFEFINQVRVEDITVPIVVISSYDYYVHDSVKFNIFDFIRKKNLENEIYDTLNRLVIYLENILPIISLKNNNEEINVKIRDIIYIESYSHDTIIHTLNRSYDIKKDTKLVLKDNVRYFVRVHRSYYVNNIYVQSIIGNSVLLKNGIIIPIGKTYFKSFKKLMYNN